LRQELHFVAAAQLRGRDEETRVIALQELAPQERLAVHHRDAAASHGDPRGLRSDLVAQLPSHLARAGQEAAIEPAELVAPATRLVRSLAARVHTHLLHEIGLAFAGVLFFFFLFGGGLVTETAPAFERIVA